MLTFPVLVHGGIVGPDSCRWGLPVRRLVIERSSGSQLLHQLPVLDEARPIGLVTLGPSDIVAPTW